MRHRRLMRGTVVGLAVAVLFAAAFLGSASAQVQAPPELVQVVETEDFTLGVYVVNGVEFIHEHTAGYDWQGRLEEFGEDATQWLNTLVLAYTGVPLVNVHTRPWDALDPTEAHTVARHQNKLTEARGILWDPMVGPPLRPPQVTDAESLQTLTTTVQDPDHPDEPWVVTTHHRPGESHSAFIQRHRGMVRAVRLSLNP